MVNDCLISLRDAGRRYRLNHKTISRWVKRGYIRVMGRGLYGSILISNNDIKVLSHKYHNNPGQGKSTIKY